LEAQIVIPVGEKEVVLHHLYFAVGADVNIVGQDEHLAQMTAVAGLADAERGVVDRKGVFKTGQWKKKQAENKSGGCQQRRQKQARQPTR